MNNPYRKSPMLGGTLICLGAVLMLMCGYFYLDDVADRPESVSLMIWLAGFGYGLWILGSILLARARFSSLWAGFFCGLLLLPGLIALLTVVPTLSRQQIWQEANPGFSSRSQKRQYRDVKSLY
jgi:hypothetical protein